MSGQQRGAAGATAARADGGARRVDGETVPHGGAAEPGTGVRPPGRGAGASDGATPIDNRAGLGGGGDRRGSSTDGEDVPESARSGEPAV